MTNHQARIDSIRFLYDKAIRLDSMEEGFFYFRGDFKLATRSFQNALQDFLKAAELRPYREAAHQSAGLCYNFLGEKAKACECFRMWALLMDVRKPSNIIRKKEWAENYCKCIDKKN